VVVYKSTPTRSGGSHKIQTPSSCELFEHSAHPIVTLVLHQYYSAERRAITYKEEPEPG
jgi:hypothetical protein